MPHPRHIHIWFVTGCFLVVALVSGTKTAHAQVTFNIDFSFNGPNPPGATAPWLVATFADYAADQNKVQLTLTAPGLVGSQFANNWFFNVDPAVFSGGSISLDSSTINGAALNQLTISENNRKADGDGFYDIEVLFSNGGANRFQPGDSATFVFAWAGGDLNPTHFGPNFLSVEGGGEGTWPVAAHIQGYAPVNGVASNWAAAIPEPGAYALAFGLLTGSIAAVRRVRRRGGHKRMAS